MRTTLLNTPYNLSLLAKLGQANVKQPEISALVQALYTNMFGVIVDQELAKIKVALKTRIYSKDSRGIFRGEIINPKQKIVVTDVIRGGIQPANLFYLQLCALLTASYVRQDHIMCQRLEGAAGVTGTDLSASKIGGSIKDQLVFIPDPMGATGHSLAKVIQHYLKHYGRPKRFIAIHLVITPAYRQRLAKIQAPLQVYAARQDPRLTKDDFILPGLGGVGEMINNTKK